MSDVIAVPHFQQSTEGYCLPACARMVLSALGFNRTEAEISQVLGTKDYGTPSFAIQRLASLGFQVIYREWSVPLMITTLEANHPVIVFVRTGFLDYYQEDFAHALVVVGASQDQHFWVHDPVQLTGPITVSWHGLLAAWSEFNYRGAVLLKK